MSSPLPTQRILCVWIPDWPIQRRIAAEPELERRLMLLTEPTRRGEFVRYGNELARRRGVRVGMPLAEARTFARSRDRLVIESVQREHDLKALRQCALGCEQYSSRIGLEDADHPECILMDVTGVAHFFGGERSLAEQLQTELLRQRITPRMALAETVGAAWAAAHYLTQPKRPLVILPSTQSWLQSLPMEGLRLPEATLSKLRRLGIHAVHQLLALNRVSLIRRLGNELLLRLDQLLGERPEPITPCRPLPTYRVKLSLESGVTHPEALEQVCSLLLGQLLHQLREQRVGTRRLVCEFRCENHTSPCLQVRLSEASDTLGHLEKLLRYQLERLRLNAPVIELRMEALEVAPLQMTQQEFYASESRDGARQFGMLLDRLSNRLGEEAVVTPCLLPSPIPERAVQFLSVTDTTFPSSAKLSGAGAKLSGADAALSSRVFERLGVLDRPPVLFPKPRPMQVIPTLLDGLPTVLFWKGARFDIACHWGPERIESGWWQSGTVSRDYFRVETTAGQWLLIFQQLRDRRWFWQGEL